MSFPVREAFSRRSKSLGPTAWLLVAAVVAFAASCSRPPAASAPETPAPKAAADSAVHPTRVSPPREELPVYTYEVVNVLPHDRSAFTQGLVFIDGHFLESTGLNGRSSLRRVEVATGRVIQQRDLGSDYFAEGLAVIGSKAYQLTWQNERAFVYDRATFQVKRALTYPGEGWGLTTDGESLILSDGTDQLKFLDPETFAVKRTLRAVLVDHPVERLNELEYVRGEIFANVWGADYLVRIDPQSGRVKGLIDLSGLLPAEDRTASTDVLNGIAYDAIEDRLFVTGKNWPKVFEIRLKRK